MEKSTKTITTACPSCSTLIYFNRKPALGDTIVCFECDETLKVVGLAPLRVDWSFMDDDDSWADIDYDDYDDDDD